MNAPPTWCALRMTLRILIGCLSRVQATRRGSPKQTRPPTNNVPASYVELASFNFLEVFYRSKRHDVLKYFATVIHQPRRRNVVHSRPAASSSKHPSRQS